MKSLSKFLILAGAWLAIASSSLADVPGDADYDGDVDLDDFALLSLCQTAPDTPAFSICQELFDVDLDEDLDMNDIASFQACFSGDTVPALPECARHVARIENGCLLLIGTAADTQLDLHLSLGDPSVLEVDIGIDGVADLAFDRSQFDCIEIHARGGDDLVWINELNGIFTDTESTTIYGGDGVDTLLGGSGGETFNGGPGDDTVYLGSGDDFFEWFHGDDTDFVEGGTGFDTVEINGGSAGEDFSVISNVDRVRLDRIAPAPFFIDIGTCEHLVLHANGGADTASCTGNLAALIQITLDGGPGDDIVLGSNGSDVLIGGEGADFLDGNQGADLILPGAGDDVVRWDPGDASDTIEGDIGHDTLEFNGSGGSEIFDLSPNGTRLQLARNLGNVVMDVNGVEQVDLQALGGADVIMVNDLSATDVVEVNVELAGTFGGNSPDTQADSVVIVGSADADVFDVSADGDEMVVHLPAEVRVRGREVLDQIVFNGVGGDFVRVFGSDGPDTMTVVANGTQGRVDVTGFSAAVAVEGALSLTLFGLDGPDSMSCLGNLAGLLIPITLDGGPGDDIVLGSNGSDLLIGGEGSDHVDGNQGADVALLGAGDDTFQWDPGDGSDTVEGEGDHDVLLFNGSGTSEIFDLSADGLRIRFTRNVGNIVMDIDGIEQFDLRALGSADTITVNDLSATDLTDVNIDLSGTIGGGSGDAQLDAIIVNGTALPDPIHVAVNSGAVEVSGLAAFVRITNPEAANDSLTINGLGGVDIITAGPGVAALIMLTINQ